jgi:two-component system OmpR family response regulator
MDLQPQTPVVSDGPSALLVEDDLEFRTLTGEFLAANGVSVSYASHVEEMEDILKNRPISVVVLDVMLPRENGLSICHRLTAQKRRPMILILSAAGGDVDRIVGLEVGADDYLAKPCNPRELLARIRALHRRRQDSVEPPGHGDEPRIGYEFKNWVANIWSQELRSPQGLIIALTEQEFALLRVFLEHPRQVLSRDALLAAVRGRDTHAFDRLVDAQVSRLRRKLNEHSADAGELIRTVRNEGYMFIANAVPI